MPSKTVFVVPVLITHGDTNNLHSAVPQQHRRVKNTAYMSVLQWNAIFVWVLDSYCIFIIKTFKNMSHSLPWWNAGASSIFRVRGGGGGVGSGGGGGGGTCQTHTIRTMSFSVYSIPVWKSLENVVAWQLSTHCLTVYKSVWVGGVDRHPISCFTQPDTSSSFTCRQIDTAACLFSSPQAI